MFKRTPSEERTQGKKYFVTSPASRPFHYFPLLLRHPIQPVHNLTNFPVRRRDLPLELVDVMRNLGSRKPLMKFQNAVDERAELKTGLSGYFILPLFR